MKEVYKIFIKFTELSKSGRFYKLWYIFKIFPASMEKIFYVLNTMYFKLIFRPVLGILICTYI